MSTSTASTSTRAAWLIPFRHVSAPDLERWFEAAAAQGWAPRRLGQWSSIRMRLVRGEPRTTRYVVDLQAFPGQEYFTTYEDGGWEHVGQMASMHVWRMDYDRIRPEAFTDVRTRSQRDRRLALAAAPSATLSLVLALVLAAAARTMDDDATRLQLWIAAGFAATLGAAIGTAAAVIWRARPRHGEDGHDGTFSNR